MPPIKWRKQDIDQLRKEVRRYNAKVSRMAKNPKYKDLVLPPKLNAKELLNTIETRAEYNKTIRRAQRLFKPDAGKIVTNKEGVKQVKYVRNEVTLKLREINKQRAVEYEKEKQIPVKAGTVGDTGLTRGEMEENRLVELKPKPNRIDKVKTQREWDKFVESVEKQIDPDYLRKRKEQFQYHYMGAVTKEMWLFAGEINALVKDYSPDEFYQLYLEYQDMSIDFIYDETMMAQKAELILSILESNPPSLED